MKLQEQPNRWSCWPTALAMVVNKPVDEIIKMIGHDGSKIIFPNESEPLCRRSFHEQEIIDVAWQLGYAVTAFDAYPAFDTNPVYILWYKDRARRRFQKILESNRGIITGYREPGKRHAVAWNKDIVYDPFGARYTLEGFTVETFYAFTLICME